MSEVGKVRVRRSDQFLHCLAKIRIIIDNKEINSNNIFLYPKESTIVELGVGEHTIYAKISPFYSEVINIDIKKDKILDLEVGVNISGVWDTIAIPYKWIFKRKSYLYIKNINKL